MSRRNRRASRRGGNYDKRNGEDDEQEMIRIHHDEEENHFGGNIIVHVVFLILPVHKIKCAVKNGARTNFGHISVQFKVTSAFEIQCYDIMFKACQ